MCKDAGSHFYFDGFYDLSDEEKFAVIDMCESCPVNEQCYNYAVETRSWGIWAGKDFKNGRAYNAVKRKKGDRVRARKGVTAA